MVMEETTDGFRIAEEDLNIRGPGEFFGTRQSGLPEFKVGHILRDAAILADARKEASDLLRGDPVLGKPEHQALRTAVTDRWSGRLEIGTVP